MPGTNQQPWDTRPHAQPGSPPAAQQPSGSPGPDPHRPPRMKAWVGIAVLVILFGWPFLAGRTSLGLILCALFLLGSTLWHLAFGHSWITPLFDATRKQSLWGLLVSFVLLVTGGAIAPADESESTVPQTSPSASSRAGDAADPAATPKPLAADRPSATSHPSASTHPSPTSSASPRPRARAHQATAGSALETLAALPVKGRAPKTGYSRHQFGDAWLDVDRNGCDTRNDVLRRDLVNKTYKSGTGECVVVSGDLPDPYTGRVIFFHRGQNTSSAVQIDHVVALSNAWQTGAQKIPLQQRVAFANDPLNLLAVDGPANQQKSDADAATWLPANTSFRCAYVARQVGVKKKYRLWVTPAEKDAMTRVLRSCPNQPVPDAANAPIVKVPARMTKTPVTKLRTSRPKAVHTASKSKPPRNRTAPKTRHTTKPRPASDGAYYARCKDAWAAGVAPLHRGESGYRTGLDRDGDGIACEEPPR